MGQHKDYSRDKTGNGSQGDTQRNQHDSPQYRVNQQGYGPTQEYGGGPDNPYDNNIKGNRGASEPWRNDSRSGNDPRAYSEDFSHAGYGGYGVSSENQDYGQMGVPMGSPGREGRGDPGDTYQSRQEQYRRGGYQGDGGMYQDNRSGVIGEEHTRHFDPNYRQWRAEHIRQLDEEYLIWRKECYGKFADEFNQWRSQRQAETDKHADSKPEKPGTPVHSK